MIVLVNGVPERRDEETSVADVVARLDDLRGTAVAVNGEVVPRSDWGRHALADGDRVEVLRAAQGG